MTVRQKEYSLIELYSRRQKHLSSIPSFWPTVLAHGPEDFVSVLSPQDGQIIDSITSMNVERYQIKNGAEGDPRSLRFTFTFDKNINPFFEDETVTKDFEFVAKDGEGVAGGLVSRPVNFQWTKLGRKAGFHKMLDLSEQLWRAEEALVGGEGGKGLSVEREEREGLWQYEKLREALEKEEDETEQGSWLDWFGYRGAVAVPSKGGNKEANGDEKEDDDNSDENGEDDDGLLDVEIFPAGEEVAIALAEDLWPDVIDYFMQAQAEEELDEDEEDSDAPELVEAVEFDGFDDEEKRPSKKQRMS